MYNVFSRLGHAIRKAVSPRTVWNPLERESLECEEMNELINVIPHNALINAVDGRELHAYLEISRKYADWVKEQIVRADLTPSTDYIGFHEKGKANNATLKQYYFTLDAAKNIALLSQSAKGKEARAYFINCEKKLRELSTPQTYIEALQALIESETRKSAALAEVVKLNALIDNEFGWCSILRAATFLGVHESTFKWQVLKRVTLGLGLEVKRVPSPRYAYQNLYPIRAFREAYPDIDFDDLTPELVEDKTKLAKI